MTDVLFADVSEFQVDVNDSYPYQFISFRSNDGTYQDHHFAYNLAWAKHSCDTGKLGGFLVYFVWEENWQETVQTFKNMVGTPHPKMAVMLDVESWGGRIGGNQSNGINAARENLIAWLGGNRKRVIGYANAGDFGSLWPSRGDAQVILANYSSNPSFPGKIAHQFGSNFNVPPFGPCDINSADGYTLQAFCDTLGLGGVAPAPKPVPAPTPAPAPAPAPAPSNDYVVQSGDTLSGIASKLGVSLAALEQANPQISNPNNIFPGEHIHRPGHAPAPAPAPSHRTYRVQSGDTMSGIASRFGVSLAALEHANPSITNPNTIFPGQVLTIP